MAAFFVHRRVIAVNLQRAATAIVLVAAGLTNSFAQDVPQQDRPAVKYPLTKQDDVVDEYFGRKVTDAYRWLEDTESEQTAAWVAAQNEVTQAYLESLPSRAPMRERLEKLWNN